MSDGNANYWIDVNGVLYDKDITSIICYPAGIQSAEFEIPYTVTLIGSYAFSASKLETVTIGEGMETIGYYSFYLCSSLKNITTPSSVTSIGSSAFRECTALKTIILGEHVETIGGSAFYSCSLLECIYFYGKTSPTVYYSAFSTRMLFLMFQQHPL